MLELQNSLQEKDKIEIKLRKIDSALQWFETLNEEIHLHMLKQDNRIQDLEKVLVCNAVNSCQPVISMTAEEEELSNKEFMNTDETMAEVELPPRIADPSISVGICDPQVSASTAESQAPVQVGTILQSQPEVTSSVIIPSTISSSCYQHSLPSMLEFISPQEYDPYPIFPDLPDQSSLINISSSDNLIHQASIYYPHLPSSPISPDLY